MKKSSHLDPDWLRQHYLEKGLSTYEIGVLVGRDQKRIYEKLRDFGIPTRPRGLNLSGADNYMKSDNPPPMLGKRHSEATRKQLSEKSSIQKPWLRGQANGMAGRKGEANPNYKDGSSPERQRLYATAEHKAFLRSIYERDGFKCARCGAAKKGLRSLHAHHLRPWAGNAALRFDPANLITLCRKCHEWVHSLQNVAGEYLTA